MLTVTITNLTNKSIFIKKPLISTSTRVDGRVEHQIVILNESNIFPKKLEHGEVFKKEIESKIKTNPDIDESIKSFISIGHLRNILVHSNFAEFIYEQKTPQEIFKLYNSALPFLDFLKENFL